MQASREYVLAELKSVKENAEAWINELTEIEYPEGESVANMGNIADEQFRAELALMGQKLMSLAQTN